MASHPIWSQDGTATPTVSLSSLNEYSKQPVREVFFSHLSFSCQKENDSPFCSIRLYTTPATKDAEDGSVG